jgi:hypothetical protein
MMMIIVIGDETSFSELQTQLRDICEQVYLLSTYFEQWSMGLCTEGLK